MDAQQETHAQNKVTGPLQGVKVLDLSTVIMGPLATQILGDLGADIISIENPSGNTNRSMGASSHPELSGVALNLLRNKRSVVLDLKKAAGRDAFLRIAAQCDVVVTNLRLAPLKRLRLAYEDVKAVRDDIIFCRAQGFRSDSAKSDAPAYDDIIQSASGIGDLFQHMGMTPMLLPTLVADKVCGMTIAYSVMGALFHRERSGKGQEVEVPMLDSFRAFMLTEHGAGAIPQPPQASPGYRRILTPERRPQATADGFINLLAYRSEDFNAIFTTGGRNDLIDDPRFASRRARFENSDSLYRDIASALITNTTQFWLEFCERQGIAATRSASLQDLIDELPIAEHPHAGKYRQIPPPVRFFNTPSSVHRAAPLIGEHGASVLSEAGYSKSEIAALIETGALGVPSVEPTDNDN